jgi:chromosome segregation ATPase
MKYDMFNNCCSNASGDMFNASGCTMDTSYTTESLQALRNEVSRTRGQLAIYKTKYEDLAHRADACLKAHGFRCKKKYGGTKNQLLDRRNAAKVELDAAQKAYDTAVANLADAEKVYNQAKEDFDECQAKEAELAKIAAETNVEEQKVVVEQMKEGKSYAKYGLIAAGAVVVVYIVYKVMNK